MEARREEARREEATHLPEEGVSEKCVRTDKSDTEMDTCTEAKRWTYRSRTNDTRRGT